MAIERDANIAFDPDGTLRATTSWISKHDEGLAELLKNVRYAYLPIRSNVEAKYHVAAILLVDADENGPARIGVLDVGGATVEDLNRWSVWQDQRASLIEGVTQGNGGKAYLFRLFSGESRLLGVREGKRNCKGFEGVAGSKERGTPGFMPSVAAGREAPVGSIFSELDEALKPYRFSSEQLPKALLAAIQRREAFTVAEGIGPKDIWRGRVVAEDLIQSTLLHEQASIVIEQVQVYAIHNGKVLNEGKPLALESIAPFPDFERPRIVEIPEKLADQDGSLQSTTIDGKTPRGRLVLWTSKDNMDRNWKRLRPRWKVTYSTGRQVIGAKRVSELIPTTPGSPYVYGAVELEALEPDYVTLGRVRPNDGPLMRALDKFISEKLRELANEINATRRHDFDQQELDAVHRENQKLDQWKNQFLPNAGSGERGINGEGPGNKTTRIGAPTSWGKVPAQIEIERAGETFKVGKGVSLPLDWFLQPHVRDAAHLPTRTSDLIWSSDDPSVADFPNPKDGRLLAKEKGRCTVRVKLKGTPLESETVGIDVWVVDHVLLTPRNLRVPLGAREQVIAEVTNDDGQRSTDVLLNWEHDADDPLILRIRPTGAVTGNRLGRTTVSAGSGDVKAGGVWARVRAEVEVVDNPNVKKSGGGFPTLKITERDVDPETGEKRASDPDEPPLWQTVTDYKNNIWWLNLGSKEAEAAFGRRTDNAQAWRLYHAQKVVEMVVHVHMQSEFTARAEGEVPGLWTDHLQIYNTLQKQFIPLMWERLNSYVQSGAELE